MVSVALISFITALVLSRFISSTNQVMRLSLTPDRLSHRRPRSVLLRWKRPLVGDCQWFGDRVKEWVKGSLCQNPLTSTFLQELEVLIWQRWRLIIKQRRLGTPFMERVWKGSLTTYLIFVTTIVTTSCVKFSNRIAKSVECYTQC